jgi:two-component system nitrogen regulation sensor histidine kinase NtrY
MLPLFKRRSRTFWIAFSLLVVVVLAQSVKWWYDTRVRANWDSVFEEKQQAVVSSIHNSFQKYQTEAYELAKRISSFDDVRESLSDRTEPPSSFDSQKEGGTRKLFTLLDRSGIPSDMNVEIYDRDHDLLAWWGTSAGLQHATIDIERETSFVSAGSVYSYLTVIVPIMDGQEFVGSTFIHRLFDVNYPFSNRFISSSAFTLTFSRRLTYPASFVFSEKIEPPQNSIIAALQGIKGNTIGYAVLDELNPASVVEPLLRISDGISGISLTALSIAIFIVLVRIFQKAKSFWGWILQLVVVSVSIWLVRYLWLWIGFPSALFSEGIFDPRFFASPFGFGIAKSIGELFITSAMGLMNMVYIAMMVLPKLRAQDGVRLRNNFFIAGMMTLFPLLTFFLHRGFTAVVRSIVFDSTLRYSDPTSVLPSLELAIVLLNLFLIAVAFILAAVLFVVGAYRLVGRWFQSRLQQVAVVGFTLLVFGFLFGIFHPSPLVGDATRVLIAVVALVGGIVVYYRKSINWFSTLALLALTALVVGVVQLDDQVHQRERRTIELLGAELAKPSDTWMKHVLERTLLDMSNDENIDVLTTHDSNKLYNLAFTLWSKSFLSRVGHNCGVYVYDPEGHLVSSFRIGMRRSPLPLLPGSKLSAGTVQMRILEGDAAGRKVYAGATTLVDVRGVPIGSVEVGIVSLEHVLSRSGMPPFLQTFEREETERYLRTLVISEFADGGLVHTTGEDIPSHLELSEDILQRVQKENGVWVKQYLNGTEYETFYRGMESPVRVLALSWKKEDWRWHVFDFLRYVLFYLLVYGGISGIVVGGLAMRGHPLALSFRTRLFLAFFIVSLIPLLLIAYYNSEITVERAYQLIIDRLTQETAFVRDRLVKEIRRVDFLRDRFEQKINDERCEVIAAEIGTDFSIYVDAEIQASSKSELFQAEILDPRLSASAFFNITLEGKNFFAENRMIGNYDYLVGYRPLPLGSGYDYAVLAVPLLYSHLEIAEDLARRNILLFGAYAIVLVLIVVVGTVFANQISAPIRRLIATTQRIAKGELDFRLPASRKDEIGELHRAFNRMTEDLQQNRASLIKAERETAWREMAKQVAHEIKNPLTPVRLSIQHLRQAFRDKDKSFPKLLEQVTKTAIDQIDALTRIASQFAQFARMPERREEDVDIKEIVSEVVKLFDEHKDVEMKFVSPPEPMIIRADREELRRAFINIVRNAVQAMHERGSVMIKAKSDGGAYHVSIADTGPGVPVEILPRLFEPNFSTKSEGMGLGLSLVKKTIDDLHGQITIQSEIGNGTTVLIVLPKKAE